MSNAAFHAIRTLFRQLLQWPVLVIVTSLAVIIGGWYFLNDTRPVNLKPIATFPVSPGVSLELICVNSYSMAMPELSTPLSGACNSLSRLLNKIGLEYPAVLMRLSHGTRQYGRYPLYEPDLELMFLMRHKDLNNQSGYVPEGKVGKALEALKDSKSNYILAESSNQYRYAVGAPITSDKRNGRFGNRPLVLSAPLRASKLGMKDIPIYLAGVDKMSRPVNQSPVYTVRNPYYKRINPITSNTQTLPVSTTQDDVTLTIHSFVTGIGPLPSGDDQRTTFLNTILNGQFPSLPNEPFHTGLITSIAQADGLTSWNLRYIFMGIGANPIQSLDLDARKTYNLNLAGMQPLSYHEMLGEIGYLNQPVRVSIILEKVNDLTFSDALTVNVSIPPTPDITNIGFASKGGQKISGSVGITKLADKLTSHGSEIQMLKTSLKGGDYQFPHISPVLIRNDGTSVSLGPYFHSREHDSFFYDISCQAKADSSLPPLKLDSFTTITLAYPNPDKCKMDFDFILKPTTPPTNE